MDVLIQAARWYAAHGDRDQAAATYHGALSAHPDEEQLAVVEWELLRLAPAQGVARSDVLGYIQRHPRSLHLFEAFYSATRLDVTQASPDLEAALAAQVDVSSDDCGPCRYNRLAYIALAGHAYDAALLLAQKAVRSAPREGWIADTLAEVYYYRGERDAALHFSRAALALAPENRSLADNQHRFERWDGSPSEEVEADRRLAARWATALGVR